MSNTTSISELMDKLIAQARAAHPAQAPLIGVGGAQGSGKTTLCRAYAAAHAKVAHFSLDDVYLTRAEREQRALIHAQLVIDHGEQPHSRLSRDERADGMARTRPLLLTRGPPGTHDLTLAKGLIARLQTDRTTPLPRFDKRTDDRAPDFEWPVFEGPAGAILVDGWCMGALPPSDTPPLNEIEDDDVLGQWRALIRAELDGHYAVFFDTFDHIIYLQAPSFDVVRRWRGQQEEELLGRPMTVEEQAKLDRFIQHYERVTRSMLAGNLRADWIVRLDEDRNVIGIEERK